MKYLNRNLIFDMVYGSIETENYPLVCIVFRSDLAQDINYSFGEIVVVNEKSQDQVKVYADRIEKFTVNNARKLGGIFSTWLVKHRITRIGFDESFFQSIDRQLVPAFFEGFFLGGYEYSNHKTSNQVQKSISVYVSSSIGQAIKEIIEDKQKIASVVNLTRDIGNEPANVINPVTLSEICTEIAEQNNLKINVLDENYFNEINAGGILSVGKGSQSQPRMIVLEYTPENLSSREKKPVTLIGKAITFDTGGYSLKSVDGIKGMKFDKLGGITVLGVLVGAAILKIDYPVIGIICAAENMISGLAYRPDDIITTLSGKTVEIISTDAEGRLVLADGLTYAQQNFSNRYLIDIATLTGGIVTALGKIRAGIFGNDKKLLDQLIETGEEANEKLWQMPLDDEYYEFIQGDYADLKNSGGRLGHPIMGGIFLKQFIENNTPWAHLDIAGPATWDKNEHYLTKGATGFGVRLLLEFIRNLD